MGKATADEREAYMRLFATGGRVLAQDGHVFLPALDIDAFADGVVAHRDGVQFHENPHGTDAQTVRRLSWHLGWNERALRQP